MMNAPIPQATRTGRVCGWLAAGILAALPGLAESREPTPRIGFGDRVEVRVVNLEVVVTAAGERVEGLRPRRLSFFDLSRQSAETLLVRSAQLSAWPLPNTSSSISAPGPLPDGKGE